MTGYPYTLLIVATLRAVCKWHATALCCFNQWHSSQRRRLYAEEWHKALDCICKLMNKHTKRITVVNEPIARWNSVVVLWESLKRKLNKLGSVNTEWILLHVFKSRFMEVYYLQRRQRERERERSGAARAKHWPAEQVNLDWTGLDSKQFLPFVQNTKIKIVPAPRPLETGIFLQRGPAGVPGWGLVYRGLWNMNVFFCMFCMLLFPSVSYLFLLSCLCITVIYALLCIFCFHSGYPDWGFPMLFPQL